MSKINLNMKKKLRQRNIGSKQQQKNKVNPLKKKKKRMNKITTNM